MDVLEAINTRCSVRGYSSEPVSQEDLDKVFECVRRSQSAANRQWWRFVVIRDPARIAQIQDEAKMQEFVKTAPVLIACCATCNTYVMGCGQNNAPIDVSIAMENMALAAHGLGLGTCWFGSFNQKAVKSLLEIPMHAVVVGMMTLGHPAGPVQPNLNRKPMEEIRVYETWNGEAG